MITIEDLTVAYGNLVVLRNISLKLEPGLHLVIGRNGSGKSTLLKAIAGLVKPQRGKILVYGRDISKIPRRELVKLVGYTWQNPYAGFLEATVRSELEFTPRVVNGELNQEIIDILVPRHLMERNPFTLSGGEAKRVSLASILALDQPVWLLDEPFDFLDSAGVESVTRLIYYGLKRDKIVVIASANTAYLHMFKPNKIFILSKGIVSFEGSVDEVTQEILEEHGIPSRTLMCGQ